MIQYLKQLRSSIQGQIVEDAFWNAIVILLLAAILLSTSWLLDFMLGFFRRFEYIMPVPNIIRLVKELMILLPFGLLIPVVVYAGCKLEKASRTSSPELMLQPSGAQLPAQGTIMAWRNPPGTVQHHVQIISAESRRIIFDRVTSKPNEVIEARIPLRLPQFGGPNPNYVLLPDSEYIWRVRTNRIAGSALQPGWSEWAERGFRTPPASGSTIVPSNPPAGHIVETLQPTLEWHDRNLTVFFYHMQLSKDPYFGQGPEGASAPVYSEFCHGAETDPPNSYTPRSPLEPDTTYYWRVRPVREADLPVGFGSGSSS